MTDDRDPSISPQGPHPSISRAKCTAKSSRTGEPCGRWPAAGAKTCASHGGRAPQVVAAASERRLQAQARRALAELDVEAIDNPLEELALVAGQAVAWKNALAAKVNELSSIRYEASGAGTEQLRAEVALFERALDRCVAVLGVIVKLGLDARLTAISEKQADTVVRALDAALASAGVTGPAVVQARRVAAGYLRAVP